MNVPIPGSGVNRHLTAVCGRHSSNAIHIGAPLHMTKADDKRPVRMPCGDGGPPVVDPENAHPFVSKKGQVGQRPP